VFPLGGVDEGGDADLRMMLMRIAMRIAMQMIGTGSGEHEARDVQHDHDQVGGRLVGFMQSLAVS